MIAEASLIGGIFGKGGGAEVRSALTLEAFEAKFGKPAGRKAWEGFREQNDPEAPTTVSKSLPLRDRLAVRQDGPGDARPGLGQLPPRRLTRAARPRPRRQPTTDTPAPQPIPDDGSIGSRLLQAALAGPALMPPTGSSSTPSTRPNGHAIAVMGPQVGYYNPQILMEEDLHGPGIDARGAAFPGVNLYVELGHGRDYAWSATTATADNVDTFAEVLCQDEFHYLYKGECLPMEKLERTNTWTPNGDRPNAAGLAKR